MSVTNATESDCETYASPGCEFVPIVSVISSSYAFAALRRDGSVRAWGNANSGGSLYNTNPKPRTSIRPDLTDASSANFVPIVSLASNPHGFVATREDGTIRCWGNLNYGGDCTASELADASDPNFQPIISITSGERSFGLLRKDGTVRCLGSSICSSSFQVGSQAESQTSASAAGFVPAVKIVSTEGNYAVSL